MSAPIELAGKTFKEAYDLIRGDQLVADAPEFVPLAGMFGGGLSRVYWLGHRLDDVSSLTVPAVGDSDQRVTLTICAAGQTMSGRIGPDARGVNERVPVGFTAVDVSVLDALASARKSAQVMDEMIDAAYTAVDRLTERDAEARKLIASIVDAESCTVDPDGGCQTHGPQTDDGRCAIAVAREWLADG